MPLVVMDSMLECKEYIKGGKIKDAQGHSLEWVWDTTCPGDGKRHAQFRCNSHVNCAVLARAVRLGNEFWVQTTSDGAHSATKNLKGRSNAPATKAQRSLMISMVNGGSRPANIMSSLTSQELERCKKAGKKAAKRINGGLTG